MKKEYFLPHFGKPSIFSPVYFKSPLHRAATLEPQLLTGMDSLAALLAAQGRTRDLEALATRLMGVSEEQPEPWVSTEYTTP